MPMPAGAAAWLEGEVSDRHVDPPFGLDLDTLRLDLEWLRHSAS
jgi:hypothetical protein